MVASNWFVDEIKCLHTFVRTVTNTTEIETADDGV